LGDPADPGGGRDRKPRRISHSYSAKVASVDLATTVSPNGWRLMMSTTFDPAEMRAT
jgi:hypothetical protein